MTVSNLSQNFSFSQCSQVFGVGDIDHIHFQPKCMA